MRRARDLAVALVALFAFTTLLASPAQASFGFKDLSLGFAEEDGTPAIGAGSHPFQLNQTLEFNTTTSPTLGEVPDGAVKDLRVSFPPGMVGNPTAVPQCSGPDFALIIHSAPSCSSASAIGTVTARIGVGFGTPSVVTVGVYNLAPPPGAAAKVGFVPFGVPITAELGINPDPPYNVVATLADIAQPIRVYGATLHIWGNPVSSVHDGQRGSCATEPNGTCPVALPEKPFITLPRSCSGPLLSGFETDSWEAPQEKLTHPVEAPPGLSGCPSLRLIPEIGSLPTTTSASGPSGLQFNLDVEDEGLSSVGGTAESDIKKAVVTLPEGMTVNPGIAEGLATCGEMELKAITAFSAPGEGCPQASKVGEVEVETPLLEGKLLKGQIFVASPYANPFGSLIALYMVIQDSELGIVVKLPGRVDPDPQSGQLRATFGEAPHELPQIPFSHFRFHFREGARSPLATPPACGEYKTQAVFTPWANPATTVPAGASFTISTGPEAGPCPLGGTPPFHPGLNAGSLNNAAGAYTPFNVRLFRTDSEQEITHFSIKLPPGVTGKLAGIPFCSDASIGAAKARERQPHGGQEELNSPSCPAASEVGHTLVGSGVGPSLAYVPGKVYLAGPYNGSNLSIVAITAAKAGPFDLGTVVVREALRINPETAEVFVDATGSDPIPHIVNGIPVHLRDVRVYVDRPDFVLNPTSCKPTSTASTILGSGTNFASESDDQPVTVTTRFQAADCASLPYKPAVQLKLKGSTKRSGHPALTAILRPRSGDANSKLVSVALPHSEFLDQGHIKTICTRVQFKAGAGNGSACPAGSIYGHAKAWTPLLDQPLEGPVLLRSNPEHELPDLVLALHGLIDFDAVGRIDSVNGGIRNTFEGVPDAPVTKVEVAFQGGKKGLLENSTDLCKGSHNATAKYSAQSGRAYEAKVPLQPQCKGKGKKQSRPKRPGALLRLVAW